jgi:hypothetical protein
MTTIAALILFAEPVVHQNNTDVTEFAAILKKNVNKMRRRIPFVAQMDGFNIKPMLVQTSAVHQKSLDVTGFAVNLRSSVVKIETVVVIVGNLRSVLCAKLKFSAWF